ncbi:MAG: electron transfer flavoprotein subunit beta/FixA family protein [Flavobacteriales bacterium]|nr:electron transfer flavoprotein subunit beta/FixA family protein [Flavobacteriales bacterium]
MKILVCISHVPDTTSRINFTEENSKFDTNGVQFVINPNDEFGLTKAMVLKEANGGTVKVITVGDATTEPVIRKTLAIGADSAVRINKTASDSYTTALEIATYLKENPADLIIAGKESLDYNGGAVPGMIAEMLDLPFVNACNGLEIAENNAKVSREIDGGKEYLSASLPLVIGGQKGLVEESELRIPNMRGIMQARSKPLQVIEASISEDFTTSISFEKPAEKEACKLVDSNNVAELVNLLHNEAKVI